MLVQSDFSMFTCWEAGPAILRRTCSVAAATLACLPLLAGPVAARDDKPPHVNFGMATYIIDEGKAAQVLVEKTGRRAIKVRYGQGVQACGGSDDGKQATSYKDFWPVSGLLYFPEGNATKTILVETIDDKVDGEPIEYISLCLKAPPGVAVDLREQRFTNVAIVDDWGDD